ncbi:MAG: hypothetical protein Q9191_006386 [Dirinaria sp. TL-2023a]
MRGNETRRKIRILSKRFYGNKSEDSSEVIVVSVEHGISRVEPGGTSLQNYANVDAIQLALERCKKAGIKESQISILTPYRGQKMLALTILERGLYQEVSTIDSAHLLDTSKTFTETASLSAATRFGLFIFLQAMQFHSGSKKDDSTVLGALFKDYLGDALVYHDKQHGDTHPNTLEERRRNEARA